MKLTALLSLAFFMTRATLFSQPLDRERPIQVTDMLRVKSMGGISLSRDGSRAVFTLTSIEPDGDSKWDYKYVSHLYLVPADGSAAPRQLTVKEGASQPAWSPDGSQIAFVRTVDGKPQIFLLSMNGGEPVQFTHGRYGASSPRWSPDGRSILYSATVGMRDLLKDSLLNAGHELPGWPDEKPGIDNNRDLLASAAPINPDGSLEEIRAYLDNDVTDKKAKVADKLVFQDEMNVNTEMTFTHYFLQPLEKGSLPRAITHGFYRYAGVEFTPDGRELVITANMDTTLHPDRALETSIYLQDLSGARARLVLGEKDKTFGGTAVSPSGKWLAFLAGSTSFVSIPVLCVMPLHGTAADIIRIPLDRSKGGLVWSKDEKYLYFTAQSNGGVPLYRANLQTRSTEQLTDFNTGTGSFDLQGGRLVYVRTAVEDPYEVYSADGNLEHPKKISDFNGPWLKERLLSLPEKHTFKNDQGMVIEYWVMKPLHYQAGQKYPLLLDIHGGPSAMWGPGESSMWHEFQYFCARGYGVVYCNPRGSGGYGLDFLRANINNWGAGPTSDVLTALDHAVAEGWADTSRLLVSGGSYAGYLVAWIISHDHRFRAACSQRGVYDLATFFGEGNAWRLVPNYFGGYPWQPAVREILQRESPISYVDQITTPYIIFHGENDRRTGFVQGEMLYRSLKVLGRPVEYVRHPGATHEITRAGDNRQRIDQMLRTYEFFERWLHRP